MTAMVIVAFWGIINISLVGILSISPFWILGFWAVGLCIIWYLNKNGK